VTVASGPGTLAVRVDELELRIVGGPAIVEDVTLEIARGHVLALVGESGCGKTTTARALLGATGVGMRRGAGTVAVGTARVDELRGAALRRFRGRGASYVPQDPGASLDPGMRIGRQLEEMLVHHLPEEPDRCGTVRRSLERVRLPADDEFLRRFPQRQVHPGALHHGHRRADRRHGRARRPAARGQGAQARRG